jgi:hypothetical protein
MDCLLLLSAPPQKLYTGVKKKQKIKKTCFYEFGFLPQKLFVVLHSV